MGTGEAMGGTKKLNTFPSQALPCSGSTGIFSAYVNLHKHPEELLAQN
ncbi:MAG: hypothetical protein RL070_463 [Bacteroidota bacterium]|jgi:hypothetical protein